MTLVKHKSPYAPLFDAFFGKDFARFSGPSQTVPSVNIREHEKGFELEVAAPGLKKEDFKLELNEHVLSISTEAKQEREEQKASYHLKEFSYRSFKRSFSLPESANVEEISAKYEDGVLLISIPKQEPVKPETKIINIG